MNIKLTLALLCTALASFDVSAQTIDVTSTGVGLGTTNPFTSLHLVGPFTPGYMQLTLQASGTDDRAGISFLSAAGVRSGVIYIDPTGDMIFQREQAGQVRFFSNSVERMTINASGNVGIGTTAPAAPLHVVGPNIIVRFESTAASSLAYFTPASSWDEYRIGAGVVNVNDWGVQNMTRSTTPFVITGGASGGNVGIGTTSPGYKLEVAGSVRATSFIANSNTYADFVFKPGYRLASLTEVESAIQAHGHLPDIPSESEAKMRGVDIGEMQVKLLQKVEELTLYLVAHEKELQAQKQELQQLREENQQLRKQADTSAGGDTQKNFR